MDNFWIKIGAVGCTVVFGAIVIFIALLSAIGKLADTDTAETESESTGPSIEYVPAERTEDDSETTAEPTVEAVAEDEPDIVEDPLEEIVEEPEIELAPEPERSPEERVTETLAEAFGGGFLGSGEYSRLRSVDVAGEPGDYLVTVHYDARHNRQADTFEMTDIYEALYTSDIDIAEARTTAHTELVDTLTGEESEDVVWRTLLARDEAEEINWENKDSINWENVLTTEYVHPVRAAE